LLDDGLREHRNALIVDMELRAPTAGPTLTEAVDSPAVPVRAVAVTVSRLRRHGHADPSSFLHLPAERAVAAPLPGTPRSVGRMETVR
jgi:hypothetical protein